MLSTCWSYKHWDCKIITDSKIRSIICKGPKYRFPSQYTSTNAVKKLLVPYKNFVIDGASESMLNQSLYTWKLNIFFLNY